MPAEIKGLNEECGVFGVFGAEHAASLTYMGLHTLQHRGQEGAGIVSTDYQTLYQHRDRGLLSEVFADPAELERLVGDGAIGHVRYGTSGHNSIQNVQPFLYRFHDGDIALAHNGNLTNAVTLRRQLEDEGAVFQSDSDTEILIHLIRKHIQSGFINALKQSLNEVKGGFAYLLLQKDRLIAALDPNGFRPLCIGQLENGAYVVTSETCALDIVGAKFVRDVEPGELIIIDRDGLHVDHYTTNTQLAICSMEFIYFARPDSIIHGVTVHNARKQMGRLLAREHPVDADMVIGVPNSSLSAASGYAEEAGLPYEMGLIKSQYVARTFIQPPVHAVPGSVGSPACLPRPRGRQAGDRGRRLDRAGDDFQADRPNVTAGRGQGGPPADRLPAVSVPVLLRYRRVDAGRTNGRPPHGRRDAGFDWRRQPRLLVGWQPDRSHQPAQRQRGAQWWPDGRLLYR